MLSNENMSGACQCKTRCNYAKLFWVVARVLRGGCYVLAVCLSQPNLNLCYSGPFYGLVTMIFLDQHILLIPELHFCLKM